jgi:hypothetical protein
VQEIHAPTGGIDRLRPASRLNLAEVARGVGKLGRSDGHFRSRFTRPLRRPRTQGRSAGLRANSERGRADAPPQAGNSRTPPTVAQSSRRSAARSSRSPKSVVCITGTSDARRSPTPACLPRHRPTLPRLLLAGSLSVPPRESRPTGQGRRPEDANTPGLIPVFRSSSVSHEHGHPSSEPDTVWRRTAGRYHP